jgi:hypothetical protein
VISKSSEVQFRVYIGCSFLVTLKNPIMIRRSFLRKLATVPFFAAATVVPAAIDATKLKILMKSAWGSDDPTKAAFPFLHGDALSEAGHEIQIFLLGEAVSLMRKSVANAVVPVGWRLLPKFLANSLPRRYQSMHAVHALVPGA